MYLFTVMLLTLVLFRLLCRIKQVNYRILNYFCIFSKSKLKGSDCHSELKKGLNYILSARDSF